MKREFDLRPLDDLDIELIMTFAVRYIEQASMFVINDRLDSKIKAYIRHYSIPESDTGTRLAFDNHLFGVPFVLR